MASNRFDRPTTNDLPWAAPLDRAAWEEWNRRNPQGAANGLAPLGNTPTGGTSMGGTTGGAPTLPPIVPMDRIDVMDRDIHTAPESADATIAWLKQAAMRGANIGGGTARLYPPAQGTTVSMPPVTANVVPPHEEQTGEWMGPPENVMAPYLGNDGRDCCEQLLEVVKDILHALQTSGGGFGGGGGGGGGGRPPRPEDEDESELGQRLRGRDRYLDAMLHNLGISNGADVQRAKMGISMMGGNALTAARAMAGDPLAMIEMAKNAAQGLGDAGKALGRGAWKAAQTDKLEGAAGAAGEALDGFVDGLDKATGDMGIVKNSMAGWAASIASAALHSVGALRDWSRGLHQANMRFADVSAGMAMIEARQEVRDIGLRQERGARREASAERLADSQFRVDQAFAPIEDRWANSMNDWATWTNNQMAGVAESYEDLRTSQRNNTDWIGRNMPWFRQGALASANAMTWGVFGFGQETEEEKKAADKRVAADDLKGLGGEMLRDAHGRGWTTDFGRNAPPYQGPRNVS